MKFLNLNLDLDLDLHPTFANSQPQQLDPHNTSPTPVGMLRWVEDDLYSLLQERIAMPHLHTAANLPGEQFLFSSPSFPPCS